MTTSTVANFDENKLLIKIADDTSELLADITKRVRYNDLPPAIAFKTLMLLASLEKKGFMEKYKNEYGHIGWRF